MGKVVVVSAEVTGGSGGGVAASVVVRKGDEVEWLVGMTIVERVAWWCASVGGDDEGGVERRLRWYTPYKLVYGKACHLPIKLEHKAYWALKHANFDLKSAGDHRKVQLNELNELRDQAYENSLIYKEKTKKIHDSKIKNRVFQRGDLSLLLNFFRKIFSGKLKTRWTGPFTIAQVFPYGIVELSQIDGPNFKDCSDFKASRAHGFVLRSLELHILSFIMRI
ncbi:hypothetical protein Tco_0260350 [Tanacetum coccineum]